MSTPANKLKNGPASRERGATANSLEQMTPVPARLPKRGRSDWPKTETPTARSGDKSSATSPDHPPNGADDCARIMEMLGTTDLNFAKGIYTQLISASSRGDGRYDAVALFFSLAAIKGKKPKDFRLTQLGEYSATQGIPCNHECNPVPRMVDRTRREERNFREIVAWPTCSVARAVRRCRDREEMTSVLFRHHN
jgi:hypothetical protein